MIERVSELMRSVAAEAILPRFRALQVGDVVEKAPGEIVTAADREAEILLARGLADLLPGSKVLGEEAASLRPELREGLAEEADLWLVDPLDGTANFVAGERCFAVLVALVRRGKTVAGWMLDPLNDVMARAENGAGAFIGNDRLSAAQTISPIGQLRGAVMTRFLPSHIRSRIEARRSLVGTILPGLRCTGHEYPAIATGSEHFALFWRTEPWDHAAGVLFVAEAGGFAARLDRSPYVPADRRSGLLVAQNRGVWDAVERSLFA